MVEEFFQKSFDELELCVYENDVTSYSRHKGLDGIPLYIDCQELVQKQGFNAAQERGARLLVLMLNGLKQAGYQAEMHKELQSEEEYIMNISLKGGHCGDPEKLKVDLNQAYNYAVANIDQHQARLLQQQDGVIRRGVAEVLLPYVGKTLDDTTMPDIIDAVTQYIQSQRTR